MLKIFREFVPCMVRKHTDCACHAAEHPGCDVYLKCVQLYRAYKDLILIHCCFFKKATTSICHCKPDCCPKTGGQEGKREVIEEKSHISTRGT